MNHFQNIKLKKSVFLKNFNNNPIFWSQKNGKVAINVNKLRLDGINFTYHKNEISNSERKIISAPSAKHKNNNGANHKFNS